MLPDGTVNPGEMTSFNHYALGAIAQWLHGSVAGLVPDSPGWPDIVFRPRPGGGLRWAGAEHEGPYGRVAIRWELVDRDLDGDLEVSTTVPTGSRARIEWPDCPVSDLPTGSTTLRRPAGSRLGR